MNYRFNLVKRLPVRRPVELLVEPTAEQVVLIDCITDAMSVLLRHHLTMTGDSELFKSAKPFELFEVCDDLCDALDMERQCAVMLDLTHNLPKLVWNDDDLMYLQRKKIDHLRRIRSALRAYEATTGSFVSIMTD